MDLQSLSYAVVQVIHNFGAVAVVGGAIGAIGLGTGQQSRLLAWTVLLGWMAQGLSGGGFGAISWFYYARLPDIHGVAVAALLIKVLCAATGFTLAALYLYRGAGWSDRAQRLIWTVLALLAMVALTAAAFLRWFS